MVSPANTYPCLTVNLPGGCESTEPDKYYPSGTRNYARVAPADDYQGAAVAEYAQSKGVKSVYILNDREAYGLGVATTFRKAAESLGIKVAGFEAWDGKAASYESLFKKVEGTDADAVFLGGAGRQQRRPADQGQGVGARPEQRCGEAATHPTGSRRRPRSRDAGPAVAGMYLSVAGVPIDEFEGAALDFIDSLLAGELAGEHDRPVRDLRRSGRDQSCSTRSRTPTARARTSSRRCSTRRSPTGCSARSTSTTTATPRTRRVQLSASRSTRPAATRTTPPRSRRSPKPETVEAAGAA